MPEPTKTPSRAPRRWLWRSLLTIVVIVAVLTALFYWRVRAPLPVTNGTVAVDGLRGPVEIIRDIDDIPHIRANDEADALFGLG